MKKLLTFSACLLFGVGSFAQTVYDGDVIVRTDLGYQFLGGSEADFDNDGYLDIIVGGRFRDPDNAETRVILFDPAKKELGTEKINPGLHVIDRPHFVFADFNGDGIIDMVTAESGNDRSSGIYLGNGDGTFTKVEMTFSDPSYVFLPSSVDVADFNNDGLMDIIAIGYGSDYSSNAVLINKGDYHFEVTNRDVLGQYDLALDIVKILDFNNDGYMDFFVTGNLDNGTANANNGARVLADVFLNAGNTEPGKFSRMDLGNLDNGVLKQKANGGFNFADFDNDGFLDIFIMGEGGDGTGEPVPNDWSVISHLYLNKNGERLEETNPAMPVNNIFNGYTSNNTTRVIDWTGNGAFDIFVIGWDKELERQTGWLYQNDGTANFASERIPGVSEGLVLLPDYNGDGKRDYCSFGWAWDDTYFNTDNTRGRVMATVLNENERTPRPDAPINFEVTVNGNTITLTWEAAETAANNFSYEYFVKDIATGEFYTSCLTHVGGELDGVRKVTQLGNAMLNKSITLHNIPDGAYICGVQAINAAYEGSVFTTKNINIGDLPLENNSDSDVDLVLTGTWNQTTFEELYNENVTSIDFNGVVGLTELPSYLANTNCMIYLPQDSELELENANVVKGTTAMAITIADHLPFNNTHEILVESISYNRNYGAGWYSLCLPFTSNVPAGIDVKEFSKEEETILKFKSVNEISANVPYIAYLETAAEITFESNEGQTVTLSATDNTNVNNVNQGGDYTLKGTYIKIEEGLIGKYLLNPDGSGFGLVEEEAASDDIPAFRAYVEYTGSAQGVKLLAIGNDDGGITVIDSMDQGNSLSFKVIDGVLEIYSDKVQSVSIYSLDGRLVTSLQVSEGINLLKGLNKGMFIMNNQKVVMK